MTREEINNRMQTALDTLNKVRNEGYKLQNPRGNKVYFTKDGKRAGYINTTKYEIIYY